MRLQAIILLLLLALPAFAQLSPDLRLLEESSSSVVLEFTPGVSPIQVTSSQGTTEIVFRFLSGVPDSLGGEIFPARRIPILLSGTAIQASLIDGDYTDGSWKSSTELTALSTKDLSPVSVLEVAPWNSQHIAIIAVRPTIPLADGKARVYSRLRIRISFDGTAASLALSLLRDGGVSPRRRNALQKRSASDSPLAQGEWYRVDVSEDGIYKLDQEYFRKSNIAVSAVARIKSVRIFGNGGKQLSENLNDLRPDSLLEVPRYIVDVDQDGSFDPEDYILFYGVQTRGWTFNPSQRTFRHTVHPYAERNAYFVTFGGADGLVPDSVSSIPTAGLPAATDFAEHIAVEQEKFNLIKSGRKWVGESFDYLTSTRSYVNALPGLVTTSSVFYRYSVLSRSSTIDTFSVFENDRLLGVPLMMYTVDVRTSNNEGLYAYVGTVDGVSRTGDIPSERSVLKFRFGTRNQSAQGWVDWFEIHYRRRFEAVNDQLIFSTVDTAGTSAFTIRSLSSRSVIAWDVSVPTAVRRITGLEFDSMDPTICRFGATTTPGAVRRMFVGGPGAFRSPGIATRVSNSNLRGHASAVDFIILAPAEFKEQADLLAAHRWKHDSLRTLVVDIQNVYNEFSGGLQDPMAVRDFLAYAKSFWIQAPKYVLLFGGGHYDYKNITTTVRNWIPPYESEESNEQINSYTSDDYFAFLNPSDQRIAMRIGRLPARTVAEARIMVDKVIRYDSQSPFDSWRTRITFVADDDLTSSGNDGAIHTMQADQLATQYTPGSFDRQKIYLIEYPTVNSAAGRRKPDVNKAIVRAINEGTLIINYTGHGNERLWAHEAVFTREDDLPLLTNRDRLTFLVGATCNYAQYDDPIEQSSGEYIIAMESGGAIGAVTASRAVYSTSNARLNEYLYGYIFQRGSDGKFLRTGDAMWAVKQILNGTNDRKYHLFGDPTMRLVIPQAYTRMDTVGGTAWPNEASLSMLGRMKLTGTVRTPDLSVWPEFNGRAIVQLQDTRRTVTVPQWGDFHYSVNGSILYRGDVSVVNGKYESTIPIPKDVTFGGNARISVYAWNENGDASGFTENLVIAGLDSSAVPDTVGPEIEIFVDDLGFRAGDPVSPVPTLIVRLRDSSGINTSTVGIGHRLEARIVSPPRIMDLSQSYRSDLDTYVSGEARTELTNLSSGMYEVVVKAWDTYNNSSDGSTTFRVQANDQLELSNVFNIPNPMTTSTAFTFVRAGSDPIDIQVKVFSVTGRLIRMLEQYAVTERQPVIPWDGRDADGDQIGNGLYFYRIIATQPARAHRTEAVGKLVIAR